MRTQSTRAERWLTELAAFFDSRSEAIAAQHPTLEHLCYVSGRDPRLWTDQLYRDLIQSIQDQLDLDSTHTLLEVGCAAGFLAKGLGPLVSRYTGVDVSKSALKIASGLGLRNCTFQYGDGTGIPFETQLFDRAISYDVFTNFPNFEYASKVISEMVRVVKPGGKLMIGSLADEEQEAELARVISALNERLDREKGPRLAPTARPSVWSRVKPWLLCLDKQIEPRIVCYCFKRRDFEQWGDRLNVRTQIFDIHATNPYRGYRFNVVYSKPT